MLPIYGQARVPEDHHSTRFYKPTRDTLLDDGGPVQNYRVGLVEALARLQKKELLSIFIDRVLIEGRIRC